MATLKAADRWNTCTERQRPSPAPKPTILPMLDITTLRKDLDAVIARLETRKKPQAFLNVDAFKDLESERKRLQTRTEELQNQRNTLSKQIGQLKAKGESVEPVMIAVGEIKVELEASAERLEVIQADLQ